MMRPNVLKFSMAVLILMFTSISIIGQPYTKEKRIVKSYPVFDETELEVTNKYGDITVEAWDQDSVKIEVVYKVTSTKESKLEKTFGSINIDFRANKYYVVVKTEIGGSETFWSDVSDIASNLFSGGTHTSIDYTIYAPINQYMNLKLKYGNVYMANHRGTLKIDISNGNFKAHKLAGNTEFDIDFGDATIDILENAEFDLNYGNIVIEDAGTLNFKSQSSEIEIESVKEINLDSKRDKFNIEDVSIVRGNTYFSRITIDNVEGKVDLKTKYGEFKLREILPESEGVKLHSMNTTVNLYLNEFESYRVDIISNEKSEVSYAAKLGEFKTEVLSDKEKTLSAKCLYGKAQEAVPVKVEIYSGRLSLKLDN